MKSLDPSQKRLNQSATAAFTRLELLVIVLILIPIAVFLSLKLNSAVTKARHTRCISHLMNMGLSLRIFATDNGDQFPSAFYITNAAKLATLTPPSYFSHISNGLSTPLMLHCPMDAEKSRVRSWGEMSASNISYFVDLDTSEKMPDSFLVGDRNLVIDSNLVPSGLITRSNIQSLSWTEKIHRHRGNVAMGDGSVRQFSNEQLFEHFTNKLPGTSLRLLVP